MDMGKAYRQWFYDGAWHDAPKPKPGDLQKIEIEALALPSESFGFAPTLQMWLNYWVRAYFMCGCHLSPVKDKSLWNTQPD